mgnify:CR=1 FL=1
MLSKIRTWFKQFTTSATATRNVAVGEVSDEDTAEAEGKDIYSGSVTADVEPTRARTETGKFVADDPSTPDVNEAWKGGKAPKKKSKSK